jgi:plastocyanin
MKARAVALLVSCTMIAACDRARYGASPASPAAPSAQPIGSANAVTSIAAAAVDGLPELRVQMQDACDPVTFGPVASCVRPGGGVTFDKFIATLRRLGFVAPWQFSPSAPTARVGQAVVATNAGGEVHTFTRVAEFGGGIVPFLNELSRTPTIAPECDPSVLDADDFVAPGGTYRAAVDRPGAIRFQCCIHPWMRAEMSTR